MISVANEQAAAQISEALQDAFQALDRSAAIVRKYCTDEERNAYFEKLGDVLYGITFKLMEPIYWQHPGLRPENWDNRAPMDPD